MTVLKCTAIVGAAALATACIPQYGRPTRAEPHAELEVRRVYDTAPGSTLFERMLEDDHLYFQGAAPARYAHATLLDTSLVRPVPATFVMYSAFYHSEVRQVLQKYYWEEARQRTETYRCNSGRGASFSYGTCKRLVTVRRVVPRMRWVNQTEQVADGSCQAQRRFAPLPNHSYLLQYTYHGPAACSLSCFEQLPNADRSSHAQACPPAP